MPDTTDEIARIARVWPAIERLVEEARAGMWNSSETCDRILAEYFDVNPHHPRLHGAVRDVIDAQADAERDITHEWALGRITVTGCTVCAEDTTLHTHDGVRADKAIHPRGRQ